MKAYVGLDVSQNKTAICVIDEQGERLCQSNVETHPVLIHGFLVAKGYAGAKVGMETGPLSVWLYHSLRSLGLDVDCIHARHVHAALSMQLNKTDSNDAFGIAHLVRSGWYRPNHVKSLDCHQLRLMITAREKLVHIRVTLTNQIRGLLKTFGVVLPPGRNSVFERSVIECEPSLDAIKPTIFLLLDAWNNVSLQIREMNKLLAKHAKSDPVCRVLTSIPGVGTLTAISFKTAIDDPQRFQSVADVGAFLGLTPKKYQSGEVDRNGGISKHGNRQTRSLLYEAASCLLSRYGTNTGLAHWANSLRQRMGYKKAVVALARKLATVMLSMWKSGELYREQLKSA
jgi:transposase